MKLTEFAFIAFFLAEIFAFETLVIELIIDWVFLDSLILLSLVDEVSIVVVIWDLLGGETLTFAFVPFCFSLDHILICFTLFVLIGVFVVFTK